MSKNIVLKLKKLDEGLPTPAYANPGDAGLDLYAAEDHVLAPGERALIGTGIAIAIPGGYAASFSRAAGSPQNKGSPLSTRQDSSTAAIVAKSRS